MYKNSAVNDEEGHRFRELKNIVPRIILHFQFRALIEVLCYIMVDHGQFKFDFVLFCLEKTVSFLFQHFVTKDAQSHNVIHINIGISADTLNPFNEKLKIHSMHLHRVRHLGIGCHSKCSFSLSSNQTSSKPSTQSHGNEQKKSFSDSKSTILINKKIEPVDFVKIVRHSKPIKKVISGSDYQAFN